MMPGLYAKALQKPALCGRALNSDIIGKSNFLEAGESDMGGEIGLSGFDEGICISVTFHCLETVSQKDFIRSVIDDQRGPAFTK